MGWDWVVLVWSLAWSRVDSYMLANDRLPHCLSVTLSVRRSAAAAGECDPTKSLTKNVRSLRMAGDDCPPSGSSGAVSSNHMASPPFQELAPFYSIVEAPRELRLRLSLAR